MATHSKPNFNFFSFYMNAKRIYPNNQNFSSKKELFDWEGNVLKDLQEAESRTTTNSNKTKFL